MTRSKAQNTVPAKGRAGKTLSEKPRPFVLLNLAITADGKITTAGRQAFSFSSRRDQRHLLELRATVDAVMSGARTVDLNPINLGPGPARYRRLRLKNGLAEYNLRVIASGSGSVAPSAEIFKKRFSPIIVLASGRAPARRLNVLKKLADSVEVFGEKEVDFRQALCWLRERWNVKRLLCEGGGELNDALFRAGLVDELHLTVSPFIFGGRDAPTLSDGTGFSSLEQAFQMELKSSKRCGDEMFFVFKAKR
jgi:2,5-diamino-6-(ribosylamino)-4(3H)-pyrimidinone 5'-phosphate reductase